MLKNKGYKTQANDASLKQRDDDLNRVAQKYAVRVTPSVYETIEGGANDPVARQYIPDVRELVTTDDEMADPIGDDEHTPVKGIVHRYPDRVLLMPVKSCAVYCRYCFRREKVGKSENILAGDDLEKALDYIRSDENIWEVILSGGDPLVLSPRRLSAIITALEQIDHVGVIRIHTRAPVADPTRINHEMVDALKSTKAVYIAVHVNHPQEISDDVERIFYDLHMAGCVLLSQSVLLHNVNDKAEVLEKLYRRLVSLRVKPYYLHHPDKAPGTSHFRVTLKEGQEIVDKLRGRISGLCQPDYMLDLPGGHGKVSVKPSHVHENEDGSYGIEDFRGNVHNYKS